MPEPPAFSSLFARFADAESAVQVERTSFANAGRSVTASNILRYLADLGRPAASLDELHDAINGLEEEEELAVFRCLEGIAVSHASQGTWVLFSN